MIDKYCKQYGIARDGCSEGKECVRSEHQISPLEKKTQYIYSCQPKLEGAKSDVEDSSEGTNEIAGKILNLSFFKINLNSHSL